MTRKLIDVDELVALAAKIHGEPARAVKRAIRDSDGPDLDDRLGNLHTLNLEQLEVACVNLAAKLYELAGEPDLAHAVTRNRSELVRAMKGARFASRSCKACGCTEFVACDGGCHWVAADLCSKCERKGARRR